MSKKLGYMTLQEIYKECYRLNRYRARLIRARLDTQGAFLAIVINKEIKEVDDNLAFFRRECKIDKFDADWKAYQSWLAAYNAIDKYTQGNWIKDVKAWSRWIALYHAMPYVSHELPRHSYDKIPF